MTWSFSIWACRIWTACTVLQKIRNRKISPPVLILSARDAVDDRVKGLEGGADDYLVKPFRFCGTAGASPRASAPRPADSRNVCRWAI